jgi:hypothetical protein
MASFESEVVHAADGGIERSALKPLLVVAVESRMGAVADHSVLPRLPSPLIKPDVRISRIRLSDWFPCKAHGGNPVAERRDFQRSCHLKIALFRGLVPYVAD